MKKTIRASLTVFVAISAGILFSVLSLSDFSGIAAAESAAKGPVPIECGIAAIEITPPVGYRLRGYFDERISTDVHDPLFFKAIAFRQNQETALLLIGDVISVPTSATDVIRQRIEEKTGVSGGAIIIAGTHTHTGPLFCGPLRNYHHALAMENHHGTDPCEPFDYEEFFIEKGVEAIEKALASLRPMTIEAGQRETKGLSFNRRFLMKDGSVMFNPGFDNPDKIRPAAGTDPNFSLLLFKDPKTDRPVASLTHFALHLDTTGGTAISEDFPYYIGTVLKKKFGVDFLSVFGLGTAGDINHLDFAGGTKPREASEIGTRLGEIAAEMIDRHELSVIAPRFAWGERKREWPRQTFTPEELEKAKGLMSEAVAPEGNGLSVTERAKAEKVVNLSLFPETLSLDIQAIRLSDDLVLVGLPGEIFVDLGNAIKKASPFSKTILITMTQGDYLYVPTQKAFAEGSYETIDSVLAPGGGEAIVETATELLRDLKGK